MYRCQVDDYSLQNNALDTQILHYDDMAMLGNVSQIEYNKKLSYRRETARQLCIVYIGWLTDRAMHRTPQNRRGCTISDIQTL